MERLPRSMGSSRLELVFVQACELACFTARITLYLFLAASEGMLFSQLLLRRPVLLDLPILSIKAQRTSPALLKPVSYSRLCKMIRNRKTMLQLYTTWTDWKCKEGYNVVKREYLHNVYLPSIARNKFHKCFMCLFQSFWLELFTKGL